MYRIQVWPAVFAPGLLGWRTVEECDRLDTARQAAQHRRDWGDAVRIVDADGDTKPLDG